MAKQNRYKVNKELEKKRALAGHSLYQAKCRFIKWDLMIRMGREPTKDEIVGLAMDNPLTIIEVRESIREFKRARLAKRRMEPDRDPIYTWESVGLPLDRRHLVSDEDKRLHLEFLRGCDLFPESTE